MKYRCLWITCSISNPFIIISMLQPPAKEEVASMQMMLLPRNPLLVRNPLFVMNPFNCSLAEQNQRLPKLSGVHECRCARLLLCKLTNHSSLKYCTTTNNSQIIDSEDRSRTSARDNNRTLAEHVIVQQNADVIQIGETVHTKGCGS